MRLLSVFKMFMLNNTGIRNLPELYNSLPHFPGNHLFPVFFLQIADYDIPDVRIDNQIFINTPSNKIQSATSSQRVRSVRISI